MHVELLDYTSMPETKIGAAAAICYDAKTDTLSNVKRAKHCKDKGHLATMRFAYATFHIGGISRVCSHQLVRVAHAGILQRSQRYCRETNIQAVVPPGIPDQVKQHWGRVLRMCHELYIESLDAGMRKEDARYILPQACTTELNVCMNFQGWQDFLRNRSAKEAQWEIREVALAIQAELHRIAPNLF